MDSKTVSTRAQIRAAREHGNGEHKDGVSHTGVDSVAQIPFRWIFHQAFSSTLRIRRVLFGGLVLLLYIDCFFTCKLSISLRFFIVEEIPSSGSPLHSSGTKRSHRTSLPTIASSHKSLYSSLSLHHTGNTTLNSHPSTTTVNISQEDQAKNELKTLIPMCYHQYTHFTQCPHSPPCVAMHTHQCFRCENPLLLVFCPMYVATRVTKDEACPNAGSIPGKGSSTATSPSEAGGSS